MPRKGHSEEQIVFALKEVENGVKVATICRKLGISDQAFFRWKRQYEGTLQAEAQVSSDTNIDPPGDTKTDPLVVWTKLRPERRP